MKNYISLLEHTQLFSGVGEKNIAVMLECLDISMHRFEKGEFVFRQGAYIRSIMLLAEGRLHIRKENYWGNLSILNEIRAGEMFGEAYIAPDSGVLVYDIVAAENSVIISFDTERILSVCPSACRFHTQVIKNLFYAVSEKNRILVQKLGYMSGRSTREKLLSYLSDEARRSNSSSFVIPFNRQQLADFLSVDRSAMSNELCKMRDDGILSFHKNEFTLYETQP